MRFLLSLLVGISIFVASGAVAEQSPEQALEAASKALSASTTKDGGGPEVYATFLHQDFSRWTVKGDLMTRDAMVQGLKEWWEAGMFVAKSEHEVLSFHVVGDVGVIRKKITEHFGDREGNMVGSFSGFASAVWKHESDGWKLLSVDIASAD